MQPGRHRSQRRLHNDRSLAIGIALNARQVDHLTELWGELLHGCNQPICGNPGQDCLLCGRRCRNHGAGQRISLRLLQRCGCQNGFALAFPVAIYEGIEHDAMQPRFQIGARDKTAEAGAGASNGILYEIFSILAVPGQLQSDSHQLSAIRHRLALEPLRQFWTHPCSRAVHPNRLP